MKSKIIHFYLKRAFIKLIKAYTLCLKYFLVIEGCRYHPTCSRYMRDAIMYNGVFKGTWAGIRRIFRCHPWISPDTAHYDPVKIIEKGN